jgi:hypothetical protein
MNKVTPFLMFNDRLEAAIGGPYFSFSEGSRSTWTARIRMKWMNTGTSS